MTNINPKLLVATFLPHHNIISDAASLSSTPTSLLRRNPATKRQKVGPRAKRYRLVFDKRVVDPNTFQSYPAYGYTKIQLEEANMENVETLKDF